MTSPPALLDSLATLLRSENDAFPAYLDWIKARFAAIEPEIQAFLPEEDRFDRLAAAIEGLLQQNPQPEQRPPLFGMPIGVKDIFHVNGFDTHAGSRLPVEVLAGDQALSVTALRDAGALILGKTVTTEFAYFAPGPTRNPHDSGHTPGGSSSGSAAAVAAGLAPLALGTQTIGSINRPAAFCGVVGYKPTHTRISTSGVIPLSPTFDHVGIFTPDAASAAWVAPVLVPGWAYPGRMDESLRLAVPVGPYLDQAEAQALAQFELDCDALKSAGHEVYEIPVMADFAAIVDRHNLILAVDAARVHQSWFGDFSEKYHAKTSALIWRGETIADTTYQKALQGKQELKLALEAIMQKNEIDAWVTPSAPGPAPEGLESTGDPVMNLPWTQCGMPSVTLPSGRSPSGLPLGFQMIARAGMDEQLLAWASRLEPCFAYEPIHGLHEFLEAQGALAAQSR